MGVLSGNPKDEPLHYGEIFDLWSFSAKAKGCVSVYKAFQYHAGDEDLQELLADLVDQAQLEAKECDQILVRNDIAPSPYLPERPKAQLADIPVGARFTDPEICALIGADLAASITSCSQMIGKSIREDVAGLFGKYHNTKVAQGLKNLRLSKDKGWLVPPPLQIKVPELVQV
ncbi:MAG: rane protein [Paenibacillaceae bacterium]|jgi:hypothetical protein|nr:rane protein [Paenibacillaceae bacterium]